MRNRALTWSRMASASVVAAVVACGARSGLGVDLAGDISPDLPATPPPSGAPGTSAPSRGDASVPTGHDAAADAPADHDAAVLPVTCLASSHQTHGVPTDLFFMVDKSGSMNTIDPGSTTSRWQSVLFAMNDFLSSPDSAGLGAGIAFFPISEEGGAPDCNATDYAVPVVPVEPLPLPVTPIGAAILTQVLARGTPTTPALQGAYRYTQTLQVAEPNRDVAVLVVTDGNPTQCGSTIANASTAASVGAASVPPIRTYVLGIGPNLANLNAIAQAGGTGHAYLVESGGAASLTTALNAIRADSIACDYVLPPLDGAMVDGADVSVQARAGLDAVEAPVLQVAGAASCGPLGGWFFDNPASPTRITLCAATCDPLQNTSGSALDILVDCH
jgi:hypothetical protein